jgi:hypothetical protein
MDTQYYEPIPFHESLPSSDANQECNATPENTTTSEQDRNHIYEIEEQQETQPYVYPPTYNDDRTEESQKSLPLSNERADSTNAWPSSSPPPSPLTPLDTLPLLVPQTPNTKSSRKRRQPDRFHEDQELLNQKCRRVNLRSTAKRPLNPEFETEDVGTSD